MLYSLLLINSVHHNKKDETMVQRDMRLTSLLPMAPVQFIPSDGTIYMYSITPLTWINCNDEICRKYR